MKTLFGIAMTLVLSITALGQNKTLHDFIVTDINGQSFDLAELKGKKVLVVNTASKCGYTPQYDDLQKLHTLYRNDNFVVIGFPANNFMNQEPGSNAEIKEFCSQEYGVTFPMMQKISVKGKDIHPLYQWLTQKSKNGVKDSKVKWNFQKYLIDEQGHLLDVFSPGTNPLDDAITSKIK